MGAQLRAVRRRIRSVQSTAKITRAQEMIAAARIVRARRRARDAEPYAREMTLAVEALVSQSEQIDHPLTRPAESRTRAAVLVLTGDRGFAGGFNASVLREAEGLRKTLAGHGLGSVTLRRPDVRASPGTDSAESRWRGSGAAFGGAAFENAARSPTALLEAYGKPEGEGGVDEVHVVYTDLVSMLTQVPVMRRLLPLEIEETTEVGPRRPDPRLRLRAVSGSRARRALPWYVESRIFYAMLDSAAAEIASRRQAMKSASDNAHELIERLSRQANKARQAEITEEISEIVGGARHCRGTTGRHS